ncbi:MAG: hypothetical protein H6617_10320 [Bdellovibrionaceae bacterium]|nr:hypothetical protein [Bdellovibrionales bacterium]MCB9255064.1 hypothetical protein [Pseudobdellovibrionaceae bacterium]
MFKPLFVLALLVGITAHAEYQPKVVETNLTGVRIPIGFDDNDRIQVVAEGAFYSSCYQLGPYKTEVDLVARTVKLFQSAYVYEGFCIEVEMDYTQVMELELLPAGDWKIVDGPTGKVLGNLPVARATHSGPGPDDYLYAPVEDVFMVQDELSGQPAMVLTGTHPVSCLEIKDILMTVGEGVIVVQPIAFKRKNVECNAGKYPFQVTALVSEGTKAGEYLVHVRAMNGKAINKMFRIN